MVCAGSVVEGCCCCCGVGEGADGGVHAFLSLFSLSSTERHPLMRTFITNCFALSIAMEEPFMRRGISVAPSGMSCNQKNEKSFFPYNGTNTYRIITDISGD